MNKTIRVAITSERINNRSYELTAKTFLDLTLFELCTPIVYGSPKVATYHANALNLETQFTTINSAEEAVPGALNLLNCFDEDEEIKVSLGTATTESGSAALKVLERCIEDYEKGLYDVLVTAPVNRSTIDGFNGHANFIERKLGKGKSISLLISEDIKMAFVTNNLAIKDISESITKPKIVEKGKLFFEALRRDLCISSPRIAVLSLNPRCGEDGALGTEEQELIIPAIQELEECGIQAFGPYAADTFFGNGDYYRFDGIMAMYHDQGMTPFKTISPEDGIRLTSGLPIVRTAPAIGTKFEIAGRNQASPEMLRHAIYAAIDVFRNRMNYDEPLANPLPKLYHEKRDDSEKVRFRSPAVPQEGHPSNKPQAPKN